MDWDWSYVIEEADEDVRFVRGILNAIPLALILWVLIFSGAVGLLKLAGFLQ